VTEVTVVDGVLQVRLSRFDHVFGHLGDLEVPLGDVTSVEVVPDGLRAVPRWRVPGLAWPGRVKVGTWRSSGSRWYVVARRGQPALVLRFAANRWAGAVLTCPDAEALAVELAPDPSR
jgi:hypothetical protein